MNTPQTFVFFGIVGSGKGTQIELLQKYLKEKDPSRQILYAYPGSEFRKIVASESYTGQLVSATLQKGWLQPDFLTISIFSHMLIDSLAQDMHLIIDGYPRTLAQAAALESAMKFYDRTNIRIIYIEVGKEEATKRMKLRARSDDTEEAIEKRFDEYIQNVLPSFEYFNEEEGYTIDKINGEQSVENVHKDIIAALEI